MTSGDSADELRRALAGLDALLLDVDDTILDTQAAMVAAGTVAAAQLWPGRDNHVAMAQHYYDDPQGWFRRYASGELTIDAMRVARLEELAGAFGVPVPGDVRERWLEGYTPAFRRSQRLFDDVPGLLDVARHAELPVGLLTNSTDEDTALKLEVLDLRDRFPVVVTTDTLGVGKPDVRVYLEACRRLGAPPSRVACIGDSLEWDALGASAAGLRGVWLDRAGVGTDSAVVQVRGLGEVASALVSVLARGDLGE